MIKKLNTISPNGYNVASGGSSNVMYGEDNPRNTMKEETIKNIIKDLKDGKLSDRAIAKKFGCSDKIVSDINHGRTHRQDNESYPIRVKHGLQKLTLENVDEIID